MSDASAKRSARRLVQQSGFLELDQVQLRKCRDEPLYQQLYTRIREVIVARQRRAYGARLPSTRALAKSLGVSRNTVILAYQRLQEDGYVDSMAGGGTVVTMAALMAGRERPARNEPPRPGQGAGPGAVSTTAPLELPGAAFAVGVPPVDQFPADMWAALTSRRLRLSGARVMLGGWGPGYQPLREAIAAHMAVTRGIWCTADQVIVTRGLDAGFDLLVRTLTEPGDQVWCEDPGYPYIRQSVTSYGRVACPVAVDDNGMDVASGSAAAPGASMAIVSPARQMPLAVSMSASRRRKLLDHAGASGMWVVEHEADGAFLNGSVPPPLFVDDPHGRVIYLGSFNTALFPELHVGFGVLPADGLPTAARSVLGTSAAEVSAVTQATLADLLNHQRFARLFDRLRSACAQRRETLHQALLTLPSPVPRILGNPHTGSHLAVELPHRIDEGSLAARAAQAALAPVPLSRYYVGEPPGPGVVLGCGGAHEQSIGKVVGHLAELIRSQ